MSIKHVQEYYNRVTTDYQEMKKTLEEMEKCTDENTAKIILDNIENTKQLVNSMEVNYNRITYIMFLLNQPNKESKKSRYIKSEQKRLNKIPEKDRMSGVLKEDKEIINKLNNVY